MAGEIVAVGEAVKDWNVGDRVSSNFALDHIFGDVTEEFMLSTLGAPIDGVLTEYKVLPAHVSGGFWCESKLGGCWTDLRSVIATGRPWCTSQNI